LKRSAKAFSSELKRQGKLVSEVKLKLVASKIFIRI
jgi:hypothetical protein